MKKQAEMVHNGMILVPNVFIEYRGFIIRPKLDMGSTPWLVNGNEYRCGYIITQDEIQIMPGAVWFHSVIEARVAIDLFIKANKDSTVFWNLWNEYNGQNEYEIV